MVPPLHMPLVIFALIQHNHHIVVVSSRSFFSKAIVVYYLYCSFSGDTFTYGRRFHLMTGPLCL